MLRLGEIVMIHDLKRQGLSVSAVARRVGCDRKTVRKYLERGLWPDRVIVAHPDTVEVIRHIRKAPTEAGAFS